jgi:hypothetical protein
MCRNADHLESSLVVVNDVDFFRAGHGPPKTDSILVVDSDAVLPLAIPSQGFQSIAPRDAELFQRHH